MKQFSGFEHGINLGGWLSQCVHTFPHYEAFIKEADLKRIREWGLDHVRVPIDYNLVEDKDGNPLEEGFELIDRACDWCRKYGLNIILDLHKTFGFSFDSEENETGLFESSTCQERFYSLWERLAERYGREHDFIAFELLNEVTEKKYSDVWNEIISRCIPRIRKKAPESRIIIGGYHNNSIEALPDLILPADDGIVYTFHCYEPLIFTHQGAHWAPGMNVDFRMSLKTASYRDMAAFTKENLTQATVGFGDFEAQNTLGPEFFDRYFSEAVSLAEKRNVPLYCGEYGVINLADPSDTLLWYELIADSFDRFRIGRSAWTYHKMDFGILDGHMDSVRERILKRL